MKTRVCRGAAACNLTSGFCYPFACVARALLPATACAGSAPVGGYTPNFSRTCLAVTPATRITLLRLVWPEVMVTEDRGTRKSFAKNSMQASLARPSTGGVVRETFNASPSSPVMAFFLARG